MRKVIKILFVCHGNICRSVMAEYILRDKLIRAGEDSLFEVDSAAMTTEEIGNPIYPPAKRKLAEKGVPLGNHRARLFTRRDYEDFDIILAMDEENLIHLERKLGGDPQRKIRLLSDYCRGENKGKYIADPWYTRDFETAYNDIDEAVSGLFARLHRSQTVMCYIGDGENWLMLHRTKKKDDPNEGKWIGVGGHMEAGETPEDSIRREVMEETGLTLDSLEYRGVIDFYMGDHYERMYVFLSKEYSGSLIECDEGDLAWIRKEDFDSIPMWEGDRKFIPTVMGEGGKFRMKLFYREDGELEDVLGPEPL